MLFSIFCTHSVASQFIYFVTDQINLGIGLVHKVFIIFVIQK